MKHRTNFSNLSTSATKITFALFAMVLPAMFGITLTQDIGWVRAEVPVTSPVTPVTPPTTVEPTATPAPTNPPDNNGGGSSSGGSSGGGNSGGNSGGSPGGNPGRVSPHRPVIATNVFPARKAKRYTRLFVLGYDDDASETITMAFGDLPAGMVQGPSRTYTLTTWKKVGKKWVKSTRKYVQGSIQGTPITLGVYMVTVAVTDGATTTFAKVRLVITK